MKLAAKAWVASFLAAMVVSAMALAADNGGKAAPSATVSAKTSAPGNKITGIILPAGTTLHVRLETTLTSKTNKTGDKFSGIVDQAVMANGQTVVPKGSLVSGHVVFVKPSKRIRGVGQMRIVLDNITTENNTEFPLTGSLDNAQGSPCTRMAHDNEGTIKGCGKSLKGALKGAAIGGAMGAGAGATVGMGHEIDCNYFGNCGGPSFGADVGYGAAIGAGATLIYNLFKHEKTLILIQGTELTFIVDRSVPAIKMPADVANSLATAN
jgi:hypothetical protein